MCVAAIRSGCPSGDAAPRGYLRGIRSLGFIGMMAPVLVAMARTRLALLHGRLRRRLGIGFRGRDFRWSEMPCFVAASSLLSGASHAFPLHPRYPGIGDNADLCCSISPR